MKKWNVALLFLFIFGITITNAVIVETNHDNKNFGCLDLSMLEKIGIFAFCIAIISMLFMFFFFLGIPILIITYVALHG